MPLRRLLALMAVGALLLGACSDGDDDGDGGGSPDAATEADGGADDRGGTDAGDDGDGEGDEDRGPGELEDRQPPAVELLDAGAEPRSPLRLSLEEGARVPATLTFEEEVLEAEGGAGQPDAPQGGTIDLVITVEEVADDRSTLGIAYEEVTLDGREEGEQDPLAGVEGRMVLDERSRLVAATTSAEGLHHLPVPFPEEEVGEGAVWEVRTEGLFGLPATEIKTVELVSRDGDEYELAISSSAEGPDEPTAMPGTTQQGAEMTLEELGREGTGEQHGTLAEPFPVTASLETETRLVLDLGEPDADAQGDADTDADADEDDTGTGEGEADTGEGEADDGGDAGSTGPQRQVFREEITFERR